MINLSLQGNFFLFTTKSLFLVHTLYYLAGISVFTSHFICEENHQISHCLAALLLVFLFFVFNIQRRKQIIESIAVST